MIPYDELEHNAASESLVDVLCDQLQIDERLYFRVIVAYYMACVASHMRTTVQMPDGSRVPANVFALNLAPSGFGKGRAMGTLEDNVFEEFRQRFMEETFPTLTEDNLPKIALKRSQRKGTDPDEELVRVEKEFEQCGELLFSFDGGTDVAAKQMRHKLLMSQAGGINLQVDEIGKNLPKLVDMLDVFLELYDGKVKAKLVKNTQDNTRFEEIKGTTPTNMVLFGSPTALLNGGKQEDTIMEFLDTGYARRCLFGYIKRSAEKREMTPEEALKLAIRTGQNPVMEKLSEQFEGLADMINANKVMPMPEETALIMFQYKLDCEQKGRKLKEHEETRKIELEARFFKAAKLAGVYAFCEDSTEVKPSHMYSAIKLVEESGAALYEILNREKPYVKLARYIANIDGDVTHADLMEDLAFYPKPANQRQDMLNLAIAWGYKNNIVLKKAFQDGIEFLSGEALKETDTDNMIVSYSDDVAFGYEGETPQWSQLWQMVSASGVHWANHHFMAGHRHDEKAIPGFNLIVLDVDGGIKLPAVRKILEGYKALIYTTKRHDPKGEHRFRIILPTNYVLKLDRDEYKEFMSNLFESLPFEADSGTGQRNKKWLAHDGNYEYLDGQLFDVLPFIPKTSKNEQRQAKLQDQQSLDNLERWMLNNSGDGNRNNMLLRYAMLLVDNDFTYDQVRNHVVGLNEKMPNKLREEEIMATIMVSVGKAIAKKP